MLNPCLNKQKGNMYPWVDYTFNPIRGRCPHQCAYCYMKHLKVGELRLEPRCLDPKWDMPLDKTIFVGSSTDMWAREVPDEWILRVLAYCAEHLNQYVFQSKNPKRFIDFCEDLPDKDMLLGTTIETNRYYSGTQAPQPSARVYDFLDFVSIEPIMRFDLQEFTNLILSIKPRFVSIGADSQNNHLDEPTSKQVRELIWAFTGLIEVREKTNLKRLM